MKRTLTGIAALTLALTMTACGGMGGPSSAKPNSSFSLDSMPEVTAPEVNTPTVNAPEGEATQTDAPKANNTGEGITDDSGEFVYTGKLQPVGDDENGYIQVPLGYLPFQDEDVEGLTQYCDTTGKNIVTLDRYDNIDYQTVANNLRGYMEAQEDIEDLNGAKVTVAGYTALQLYGHYTDGYFLVAWSIQDPAHPDDRTYYLAMEFDSEHQYLMACSSTFQTVEDHDSE